jgi:hypothetical protein
MCLTLLSDGEKPSKRSDKRRGYMTVKELRQKLTGLDEGTNVIVFWERDDGSNFLDIHDAATAKGTLKRDANGKAGFEFDSKGPATWLFINVSQG